MALPTTGSATASATATTTAAASAKTAEATTAAAAIPTKTTGGITTQATNDATTARGAPGAGFTACAKESANHAQTSAYHGGQQGQPDAA